MTTSQPPRPDESPRREPRAGEPLGRESRADGGESRDVVDRRPAWEVVDSGPEGAHRAELGVGTAGPDGRDDDGEAAGHVRGVGSQQPEPVEVPWQRLDPRIIPAALLRMLVRLVPAAAGWWFFNTDND